MTWNSRPFFRDCFLRGRTKDEGNKEEKRVEVKTDGSCQVSLIRIVTYITYFLQGENGTESEERYHIIGQSQKLTKQCFTKEREDIAGTSSIQKPWNCQPQLSLRENNQISRN